MNQNPLNRGVVTNNTAGIGPVTRAMLNARTRELALIAGRVPPNVSQADYERAERELTGESDVDQQDAILDALPEAKRWDPVPGSTGHQAPQTASEDEDAEGRSETEQLVDDGAEAAARDRMLQAAKSEAKADERAR